MSNYNNNNNNIPILKNNVKPRQYQEDAFNQCISRNTILVLPTGMYYYYFILFLFLV